MATNINTDKLSFCIDYLRGTLPIVEVDKLFRFLSDLHPELDYSYFFIEKTGYKNYSTKITYHIENRGFFMIAYKPELHNIEYKDFFLSYASHEVTFKGNEKYNPIELYNGMVCGTAIENYCNPYIFIECSGSFLSWLRHSDCFVQFFQFLADNSFQCSRLDVAADFFEDNRFISESLSALSNTWYIPERGRSFCSCISRTYKGNIKPEVLHSYTNFYPDGRYSVNYEYGTHSKNLAGIVRIYDKFYEQKYLRHIECFDIDFWYRFEIETHCKNARESFEFLCECGSEAHAWIKLLQKYFVLVENNASDLHNCDRVNEFDDFFNWCLSQNGYFVAYQEFDKPSSPYIKYVMAQKKVAVSALNMLLLSIAESGNIDFAEEFIKQGYDKIHLSKRKFEIENISVADFTSALLNFMSDYVNEYHPSRNTLYSKINSEVFSYEISSLWKAEA